MLATLRISWLRDVDTIPQAQNISIYGTSFDVNVRSLLRRPFAPYIPKNIAIAQE